MPIISQLGQVMAKRGIGTVELASRVGIAPVNLSRIKTGQFKSIRFSTLGSICRELDCQPEDILKYVPADQLSDQEKPAKRQRSKTKSATSKPAESKQATGKQTGVKRAQPKQATSKQTGAKQAQPKQTTSKQAEAKKAEAKQTKSTQEKSADPR